MARIRTVKPEFFTSPDIAKLSYPARLLYIAMWCWADDYGKGETNLNGLLGLAFPESDDLDRKDLQRLCKEVQCGCKVIFYMVNERAYYAIPSWDDHQRTQRKADSRIPDPEDPGASLDPRFHAEVEPVKEKLGASLPLQGEYAPGTEEQGNLEQGNSGAGEQPAAAGDSAPEVLELIIDEPQGPTEDQLFERFWAEYPSKAGRKPAREKFTIALRRASPEEVIDGAHRYAVDPNRAQAFTKHASTWLHNNGWEDPPLEPRPTSGGQRQTAAQRKMQTAHERHLRLTGQQDNAAPWTPKQIKEA